MRFPPSLGEEIGEDQHSKWQTFFRVSANVPNTPMAGEWEVSFGHMRCPEASKSVKLSPTLQPPLQTPVSANTAQAEEKL